MKMLLKDFGTLPSTLPVSITHNICIYAMNDIFFAISLRRLQHNSAQPKGWTFFISRTRNGVDRVKGEQGYRRITEKVEAFEVPWNIVHVRGIFPGVVLQADPDCSQDMICTTGHSFGS